MEAGSSKKKRYMSLPESLMKVVDGNDLEFIRKVAAFEDEDECLRLLCGKAGNIFGYAAIKNNFEFMEEATKILPRPVVKSLYVDAQFRKVKANPLHIAAGKGHRRVVKVILDFFKSETDNQKPWLYFDENMDTPLHDAIARRYEGIALDICSTGALNLDENDKGENPLYMAVKNVCNRVAFSIVNAYPTWSLTGPNATSALFYAANCSDLVMTTLVEKAPELIIGEHNEYGNTVLHNWVRAGRIYPFEYVLEYCDIITPDLRRDFIAQLATKEKETGFNPLHCIVSSVDDDVVGVKIAEILVNAYKQEMSHLFSSPEFEPPWLMEDIYGNTPLHMAITSQRERLALYLLSLDSLKFLERSAKRCASRVVDGKYNHNNVSDDDSDDNNDDIEDVDDKDDDNAQDDEEQGDDSEDDDDSEDEDDDDDDEVNLLLLAIKKNCPKVAEEILNIKQQNDDNLDLLDLVSYHDGGNALNFAPLCTEAFLKQLLETDPQFITQCDDDGNTLLHHWINLGRVWAFKYILKTEGINSQSKSSFIDLLSLKNTQEKGPLHLAAESKSGKEMVDIVKAFLDVSYSKSKFITLWSNEDHGGNTPLQIAISNRHEELALLFLSTDDKLKNVNQSLMFEAINHECHRVVQFLLDWTLQQDDNDQEFLRSTDVCNVLHVAWKSTEENGLLIVEKWPELINENDDSEKKPLERASEAGKDWLVEAILQKDRSSIEKTPLAWVDACKNGYLSTVLAFVENSPYFRSICYQQNDTPLHHIQNLDYKGYQKLLQHPFINELKNAKNKAGETPLHIAIQTNNKDLAEILLTTDGVDWNLKDNTNKSAKDLLKEKCKDHKWASMCKLIGLHQMLKSKYIDAKTNLMEMRGTISVVATLLATITITAGFAVPGGVDSNGDAVLSGTGTFWVFVLSNTYAMCCAILILFCNTWSMVSDNDKALRLIDRSLWLLKQSLYGTLVAFTLAMYTVIHKKSLWAAIVVVAMVFLVVVLAQRAVLYKILDMLKYFEDKSPQVKNRLMSLGLQASSTGRRTHLSAPDDIENQATEVEIETTVSVVKKSS